MRGARASGKQRFRGGSRFAPARAARHQRLRSSGSGLRGSASFGLAAAAAGSCGGGTGAGRAWGGAGGAARTAGLNGCGGLGGAGAAGGAAGAGLSAPRAGAGFGTV
jgi:hypothetical protein